MAHMIDMTNDRANMAYIGQKPWHGLGQELTENAPLEVWCKEAGLDWNADESPIFRASPEGMIHVPGKKVLSRSDNGFALGVVSDSYQVVQPGDVLEFYRDMVDSMGFKIETAGSLRDGRRVWALARTGEEMVLPGDDKVDGFVLLATSYDGTMATVATRTSVRVVCNNTLSFAVGEDGSRADVKITHGAAFDAMQVKALLGIGEEDDQWNRFKEQALQLSDRKVSKKEAITFMMDTMYPHAEEEGVDISTRAVERNINMMMNIYENGVGQDTASANGTAWGLLNAVTRYVDHEKRARSNSNRMNNSWFGDGRNMKEDALTRGLALAA